MAGFVSVYEFVSRETCDSALCMFDSFVSYFYQRLSESLGIELTSRETVQSQRPKRFFLTNHITAGRLIIKETIHVSRRVCLCFNVCQIIQIKKHICCFYASVANIDSLNQGRGSKSWKMSALLEFREKTFICVLGYAKKVKQQPWPLWFTVFRCAWHYYTITFIKNHWHIFTGPIDWFSYRLKNVMRN